MRAGTAVNNCATAGKDTASSLNAARAATDEMGCTCYWGMAEKEREGCSISPGTNFAANKGEELFGGLNLGLAGSLSVAAKHGS